MWPNESSMVEHICSLIHYVSAVTEEDCLKGLGIAVGVTTACSKVGVYLCPLTLGIGCIVSAICEGVKEGVVTELCAFSPRYDKTEQYQLSNSLW